MGPRFGLRFSVTTCYQEFFILKEWRRQRARAQMHRLVT
jgi:hypothetical protein